MPSNYRFCNGSPGQRARRGQALIEFAFVSIILVTLFTVAFSLGLMLLQGMVAANAGASAGRILHHHPRLSPEAFAWMRTYSALGLPFNVADPSAREVMELITFDDEDFSSLFGDPLYDETRLLLNGDDFRLARSPGSAILPELNKLLLPNYIYDADRDLYRYPGAVVERIADNALTVLVPLTEGIADCCFDTGDCDECNPGSLTFWLPPLRVCKVSNTCSLEGEILSVGNHADGTFAVTITFPAQAGALVAFEPVDLGDGDTVHVRVLADDSTLIGLDPLPAGYALAPVVADPSFASLSTRGDYGLGELTVLDMSAKPPSPILVRPYRRVISHTSAFRLGQRFEAMLELAKKEELEEPQSENDAIKVESDQPNNFSLTSMRFDPAQLFLGLGSDPPDMRATIPVTGKYRVQASAGLVAPLDGVSVRLKLVVTRDDMTVQEHVFASQRFAAAESEETSDPEASPGPGSDPALPCTISGSIIVEAKENEALEVRILHDRSTPLELTNDPSTNWISVEAVFLP